MKCVVLIGIFVTTFRMSFQADPIEGLLPGAPCFEKISSQKKCNGTLLESFERHARGSGNKGVNINEANTLFFLFTRKNQKQPEFLHDCHGRLPANTNFKPNKKTEVFVHGWLDGACRTAWMREMRDQLFYRGSYNVILVDWTWGNFDYSDAAKNYPVVGEQMAFVLNNIIKQTNVDPNSIHIIGHSFGSHAAGVAGENIENLGRITGLDPAFSPSHFMPKQYKLDRGDAILVDVIHSNGDDCFATGIGDKTSLGHADFYPNGGHNQLRSCSLYILISFLKLDLLWATFSLLIPNLCSHVEAIQYYKLSINPCDCYFVGVECENYDDFKSGQCRTCRPSDDSCAVMGMDFPKFWTDDNSNHKYYLDTQQMCPYCITNEKMEPNNFARKPMNTSSYCKSVSTKQINAINVTRIGV